MSQSSAKKSDRTGGKLRIGDNWNAITIIALSQSNPLKAVAEFVENCIDARARRIVITRGKEKGEHFLRIKDDGEGVRKDESGIPDFHYVATHICDSIKRQMKSQGAEGIQGEFGIGLLSFWTVGEELILASAGSDGKVYQMHMNKGEPSYQISQKRTLFPDGGTELTIKRILPGIKQFSGEKIQWYLASELRDRIRTSGVQIKVVDRTARAEFKVEPRQFEGRLLHELSKISPAPADLYLEVYLNKQADTNRVGLYRGGTRVLDSVAELADYQRAPWTSGFLQGIVDVPYLNLTPGTRAGIIHDENLERMAQDLQPIEAALLRILEEQQRAEEERASQDVLRSIQKALKEALMALPAEEYDWFNIREGKPMRPSKKSAQDDGSAPMILQEGEPAAEPVQEADDSPQKQFFEFAGPLYSVRVSPASSIVPVNSIRNLRAIPRDRSHHLVEENLLFTWVIAEGEGQIENASSEIVRFAAPKDPGLIKIQVIVRQGEIACQAEALITVTDSLIPESKNKDQQKQGIPSYTFQKAPGELWRSKYDSAQNVIVINSGHRDFVFAARNKALKIRYICRLFAKELVLRNFPGIPPDQLLERLIELSLHTEENL